MNGLICPLIKCLKRIRLLKGCIWTTGQPIPFTVIFLNSNMITFCTPVSSADLVNFLYQGCCF